MKLNTYLSLLLLILVPSQATAVTSSPRIQQGDSLVQEGVQYLNTNQPQKALQRFQDAESVYEDAQHPNGFNGAVINQSIALKRLGQYYRACTILTGVLTLNREICQRQPNNSLSIPDLNELGLAPEQQLAALQNLGNNLQLLGQLESSVTVLKQATTVDPTHPDIILSLANSYQSQYKDAINKLSISIDLTSEATATNTAQEKALEAISLYTSLDSRPSHRVHAQLNSLQLIQHIKTSNSSSLRPVYQQSQHLIKPYISNLTSTDFGQFHEVDAVNLELKLSGLLNDLGMTGEAFHHARSALAKANILQDSSLRSQAFGTLGKIYLGVDQLKDAKKVFSKALKLAQSSNDDSLAYQWSWQLAQIYQQSS